MSDQGNSMKPNGAAEPTPRKSLREFAEEAYDEVIEAAEEPAPGAAEEPSGQGEQPRDKLGRFATKETKPGEAAEGATEQPQPSPETEHPAQQQEPAQPAKPVSSEAPAHWGAADRETFSRQTPEAQQFLLRRHQEMESDYQRKVQANAAANQFTQALAPIFNDPVISGSLRENNLSAAEAIRDWATMHKRAMSPNVQDRANLWHEIGQRLGLDPAAVYGQSRSGPAGALSDEHLKDPAIRYFADHVSRTVQDVQALRGQITAMQQAAANQANAEAMKVTRWGIDNFAEELGPDGKKLRPDFDAVLPQIIELFSADPNRDLRTAYEQARWMNPETRARLIEGERQGVQRKISDERAKLAVRTNTRGLTSPVSKPQDATGKPLSLRETMEAAADEVGFGN